MAIFLLFSILYDLSITRHWNRWKSLIKLINLYNSTPIHFSKLNSSYFKNSVKKYETSEGVKSYLTYTAVKDIKLTDGFEEIFISQSDYLVVIPTIWYIYYQNDMYDNDIRMRAINWFNALKQKSKDILTTLYASEGGLTGEEIEKIFLKYIKIWLAKYYTYLCLK